MRKNELSIGHYARFESEIIFERILFSRYIISANVYFFHMCSISHSDSIAIVILPSLESKSIWRLAFSSWVIVECDFSYFFLEQFSFHIWDVSAFYRRNRENFCVLYTFFFLIFKSNIIMYDAIDSILSIRSRSVSNVTNFFYNFLILFVVCKSEVIVSLVESKSINL